MNSHFDPYHKWLGVPAKDQPANHYRLLGLDRFESDPEVIDASAKRLEAFLREKTEGEHGDDARRLIEQVAAACRTLLDPEQRAAYDRRLRGDAAPAAAPVARPLDSQSPPPAKPAGPQAIPTARPQAPPAAPSARPTEGGSQPIARPAARPAPGGQTTRPAVAVPSAPPPSASPSSAPPSAAPPSARRHDPPPSTTSHAPAAGLQIVTDDRGSAMRGRPTRGRDVRGRDVRGRGGRAIGRRKSPSLLPLIGLAALAVAMALLAWWVLTRPQPKGTQPKGTQPKGTQPIGSPTAPTDSIGAEPTPDSQATAAGSGPSESRSDSRPAAVPESNPEGLEYAAPDGADGSTEKLFQDP